MGQLVVAMVLGVIAIEISVALVVVFQALDKKGVKFFAKQKNRTMTAFSIGALLFIIALLLILK